MTTNFYVEEERADTTKKRKTNSNYGFFSKNVNKGKEQQQ